MQAAARSPHPVHEHEFEPQHGLPERLPAGERILWQGAPDERTIARRVFHLRKVALYFALLLAWRCASMLAEGGAPGAAAAAAAWIALPAALALGLLALLARWTARSACYTLTDRRLVMRIGIVLTVSYNLPLRCIEGAQRHDAGGGCADIALTLERGTRIAWLHLWPHARPWRLARPQPMLRALRDADTFAQRLAEAWSAANGVPATAARGTPAGPRPVLRPGFAPRHSPPSLA
jgi:hypothetical protein